MSESLKYKTIKGLSWNFIDTAASQILRFVIGLILARLLMPKDYGLIGIALIFINIFEQIIDGGFTNALIQKKAPTNKDYGTAFFCNLGISIVLYIILFFCSPFIAAFFNEEQLVSIIRVISLIIIIDAFMLVQKAKFTKLMDFKTLAKMSVVSSILSGCIGIALAVCGFGVWSLVAQQTTRHLINASVLWYLSNGFVFVFSLNSFTTLFSFGSKLMFADLLDSIYKQIYQIVIGKVYTSITLGLYTRAYQFGSLFSVTISQMVQRVSFPALSSLQNDDKRLLAAYRMLIKSTMYVSFPCMFCLAAVSRSMMITLVGEKWLNAVPYLQILCFSMVFTPLLVINMNILKVKGRSDLYLILEIVKKAIGVIPIAIGIFTNIYWMLFGCVIENILVFLINSFYSGRLIQYNMREQIADIFPSFALALFAGVTLFSMSLIPISPYWLFPMQLLGGFTLIIIVSEIVKLEAYSNIKTTVLSIIANRKKSLS